MTKLAIITNRFGDLWDQMRHIYKAISANRVNKIVFTVSIGAIGVSLAANYYFRILSLKNKRILNKNSQLIEMVI